TSGNYFAWVDDSSPHSTGTTLESPFIDVTALTNPMLSFFLISDNEGNSNVDFSVDVWDGAAWNTGVYTSNTNTLNGGWEQINVVLSSLTITGDIRLRFIVDENNGTDFYDDVAIDDVEIKEAPACPDPSALTATNITATSADLGWTENGTATTWDIEWGTAGFVPTGIPTILGTTTNPHNLTGLTAQTSYEFYVRAMCSASDSSNWVGPFAFTTPCNAVTTFPFLEDFETTSTTRDCWSQIQEVGTANWTYATGSSGGAITTAYSGTENARFVSQSGTNSPIVKLVSPVLDLSAVNSPELAFFYGQEFWSPDQNELKVYYRTSAASAWVQIAHYTADVPAWTADTLTLPNPSATYQIAFEGINNCGRANVVDDVEVYDAITCSDPSNLTAFNIQPTSAMLDWTENGTATNWNIEWDVTGFTLGTGNLQAVAAKPYLLQGLTPGTAYDYYVQANCGLGDTSNWVGPFTFTTPPCMPIVVDLGGDTIVCSSDSILLDAGSGGNYTYSWSTGGTAQTELIDTALMGGNGTYNVSVTVTDVVTGCMYTDDINITFQLCTDIDELGNANAIAIYPNPTNGLLNVMINGSTVNTTLTIVDVQGKVVYSKNNFTNTVSLVETIDLSGNDKGIYFITLTTDKTTVVKKVILH
ncbi:MAG: fibronectin type III domain-containing protein, partial [Flavobacteriales bacterium]|nr:fibronectin type III domain-containing protein [Flavobacteriales bacterium]